MDILLVFAGAFLIYAIYRQSVTEPSYSNILKEKDESLQIGDYNPYILNQYTEWADEMHSADIVENDIWTKPVKRELGLYGIPEEQLKVNPVSGKTIVHRRENLNL